MRRKSKNILGALSASEIQLDPGICTKTAQIQLLYGFWVNLAHLAIGLCFGFANVQVPQLTSPDSEIPITLNDASWIASVLLLFCPVGCIISGIVMDKWGRRIMIIFSQVPIFIGWLSTSLAKTPNQIIIGRAIAGVGCGMAMSPPRIYCTETSLPNIRGVLGSFPVMALSIGITAQAVLNLFFKWKFLCYICCVYTSAIFFSFIFLPETPYFILITKSAEDARANLMKFRGPNYNIDREMEQLIDFRNDNNIRKLKFYEHLEALCSKASCKPFLLIVTYIVIGQLAGNSSLMFWSIELLTAANSSLDAHTGNILLALTRVVMGVIVSVLLYRVGRRILALISAIGVTLICFTIGSFLVYNDEPSVLPIICFILYNCFSNLGYATLPHLVAFELLPLQVRGILGGALISIHCLTMFACTNVQPFIMQCVGVDYLFVTFGGCSLVGCVFIYFYLPETRDLTLQEIEEYYKDIRPTLVSQRRINMSMGLLAMQTTPKPSLTRLNRDARASSMTSKSSVLAKLEAQRQLAKFHKQEEEETESLKRTKSSGSRRSLDRGRSVAMFNEIESDDEDVESIKSTKSTGTNKSRKDGKGKGLKASSKDGKKAPKDDDKNVESIKSTKSTGSNKSRKDKGAKESSKDGEETPKDDDKDVESIKSTKSTGSNKSRKDKGAKESSKDGEETPKDDDKDVESIKSTKSMGSNKSRKDGKDKGPKESSKDGEETHQASTSKKNT